MPTIRTSRFLCSTLFLTLSLTAQTSRIVVDNAQVNALSVVVQPHQKTRLHQHAMNRVMIYLQPGRQDIAYQDGQKVTLNWTGGEPKWSPTAGMHIAEITTDNPVTIVELELKNQGRSTPLPLDSLDPVKADPKHYQIAFENAQVRVVKVNIGPHERTPAHAHRLNRVTTYLTAQQFRVTDQEGKATTVSHEAGDVGWGEPLQHTEENISDKPFSAIMVELK